MIETRLGEFEEVILLLSGILGQEAYAFNIAEEFESQTGRYRCPLAQCTLHLHGWRKRVFGNRRWANQEPNEEADENGFTPSPLMAGKH